MCKTKVIIVKGNTVYDILHILQSNESKLRIHKILFDDYDCSGETHPKVIDPSKYINGLGMDETLFNQMLYDDTCNNIVIGHMYL